MKKRLLAMILTLCLIISLLPTTASATTKTVTETISFKNTDQRISQDVSAQIWKSGAVTFTNNKASSTTNVANYVNPVRLYASSSVTVECSQGKMTQIVFACNTSNYATALKNSIGNPENVSVSWSDNEKPVTVTFASAVDSFTIAKLTAQVRLDSITVTYEVSESACTHANKTTATTPASCTANGITVVTCADCGKQISSETIPALGHNYDNGICTVCGGKEPESYKLITDVSQLKAGTKVIIAAAEYDFALSTTQNDNNRGKASITKKENVATFGEDVQILTIEAGKISNTYAFNTGNGYLYAASSSKNYLRTEITLSNNSSWTISISDGVATITAQGTYTHNLLRYNSQNSIFSCYGSGQQEVCLYALITESSESEIPVCQHTGTEAVPNDDGKTHNVICTNTACNGYVVEPNIPHSTGVQGDKAATCTETAYCSVCKSNYGTSLGHSWTDGICTVCSEGCSHIFDPATGKCDSCTMDLADAKIGAVYYTTLQAALDAAADGDTVTLLRNVAVSRYVDIYTPNDGELARTFTLDLNGYTISKANDYTYEYYPLLFIGINQTVTLTDSSSAKTGKITSDKNVTVGVYGDLRLDNATIECTGSGENDIALCIWHWNHEPGYDGEVIGSATIAMAGGYIVGGMLTEGDTVISGGTIDSLTVADGTTAVTGGNFADKANDFKTKEYCVADVTGGYAVKAEHTPETDDGNCTTAVLCAVCGEETVAAKSHVFNADGHCACDAVCTALSDFTHTLDAENKTVTLAKYIGQGSSIFIPNSYVVEGVPYAVVLDSETVFRGSTILTSVKLDTDIVFLDNSMAYLFSECSKLTNIQMTGSDTSAVTDMSYLFYKCTALTALDVADLDTENVTTMRSMFSYCSALSGLTGYENWNTGSVLDMYQTFNRTSALKKIDLSAWDLDQVRNTGWCFQLAGAEQILLPDNLAVISAGFLNHATKVTGSTFTIPAGVKKVGYAHTIYDFATDDFKEFLVADGNTAYKVIDGILYSMDGTEMLAIPRNKDFADGIYEIPEGVTFLGELSFSRNYNIKKVILPDSLVIRQDIPVYDDEYIVFEDKGNLNVGNSLSIAIYCYTGIADYEVKDTNPNYISVDGILYSKDGTEVVAIPTRYGRLIVIPEGVTTWNRQAMWNDTEVTDQMADIEVDNLLGATGGVSLPASLTSIEADQLGMINRLKTKFGDQFVITVEASNPVYYVDDAGKLALKIDFSGAQATLDDPEIIYSGTAKEPAVQVMLNGQPLTAGTDYTVAYSNNVNVGTATITITGIGAYNGTVTKTFNIAPCPHTAAQDDNKCTTPVICPDCCTVTVEAYPEHSYTEAIEATRVPGTCTTYGSVEMKCEHCADHQTEPQPKDPNNHTYIDGVCACGEVQVIISVSISWGALEFTYDDTLDENTGEELGWTDDGTGWVKVENTGNTAVTVTYTYETRRTDIAGYFSDGTDPVAAPVAIQPQQTKQIWLILENKPTEVLQNTPIGTVKLTVE